jgi:Arc/MetJ-type ribon-helix-helix transcriptional regulator
MRRSRRGTAAVAEQPQALRHASAASAHTIVCYDAIVSENVSRITVTLPVRHADRLRELVAEGRYPSVSAYIAELVSEDLADIEAQEMFWAAMRAEAGELTQEEREWVASAEAVAEQAREYYAELRQHHGAA